MNFELTEEHQMVKEMAQRFAETEIKPKAAELDEKHEHPAEIVKQMGELKMMGIAVPEEYGGGGMDYVSYVVALIEISKACASTGAIMSVNNSLYCFPVMAYGTHEQKMKYLYPVAAGEKIGCYGLTEAGAGSDPAALLENTPGFKVGHVEDKLGINASGTAELVFEDARLPADALLGSEGEGFKQMLTTLDGGRIGIASQAVGIGRAVLEEALEYGKTREQFGKPITSFQAIQWKLADMATELDAAELMTLRAAWLEDNGKPFEKAAAMAKMYASDVTMRASIEGVQILGGYGYCKEYPMERHMRDAKICQIYEGTNEIMRLVIAHNLIKGK
jgi:alkylation response protein AidB-like acyl-CoA dehydrogenase